MAAPVLAEAARKRGATIHQNCAVRGIETTAGRTSGVVTSGPDPDRQRALRGGGLGSMFCRRHGLNFPQAGIRSTVFATTPGVEVAPGGLVAGLYAHASVGWRLHRGGEDAAGWT